MIFANKEYQTCEVFVVHISSTVRFICFLCVNKNYIKPVASLLMTEA